MRYKTKETLKVIGITAAVVALIVLSVWWTVGVWDECRETHSVMYCLRVISK